MRELSAQPQEQRKGQGDATMPGWGWQQFPALFSSPAVEPCSHKLQTYKFWLNHSRGEKGRELALSSGWQQFPTLLSAPAVEPRVHRNGQHTNFQFAKL